MTSFILSFQDEEVNEEDSFDPRVQTPSHVESTDDEDSDDVMQDENVEGDMINEEETNEEVEANVLYRDVNVNLEGRDTVMTNALLPNATSLVDVSVTTIAEPPLVFATTLPPPLTPLITHMQQTPVPTPTIIPSSSLQDLSNFGSLFNNLAREEGPCESFDELMDTPLDFSAFMMNQLKIDTITPELLAGPTFGLMKGTCKSLVELEYFFEEVYKATTDQLDRHKPEGQQYSHDLRKPLPLIPNFHSHQVIPFDHFINNDLAYLFGGVSSRTYATFVTKTKAVDYSHIKWIEDLVPNTIWSKVPVNYDKHALWGISYWGCKRQQFYGFAANKESARNVYSKHRIIVVTKLQIVEWHGYKHLDWIIVRRDDENLYTFKEGYFKRLRLQDIEDMLILLVQGKLTNLNFEDRLAFGVSLRMFTRSIIIQRRVEDLQLGVESYQEKLNITKPDTYRSDLKRMDAYTAYSNPRGFIYIRTKKRRTRIRMEYLPKKIWRQSDRERAKAMIQAIDKQLKSRRIIRSLEKFVGGRPYEGDLQLLQRTI
ncbi:hypothetical protein Tco_0499441 [Tanacetum coccineum]